MDKDYFLNLIANAPIQNSSRYFEPGTYLVEIDHAKLFMNRKRQPRAAVDCTIIDSNNPNLTKMTSVSWVVSLDSDSGPSTIRTFICDLLSCNESEANGDLTNRVFVAEGEDRKSLIVGIKAVVSAYEKATKSGGVFTRCNWKRFDADKMEMPNFSEIPLPASASSQVSDDAGSASNITPNDSWGGGSAAGGWGNSQSN